MIYVCFLEIPEEAKDIGNVTDTNVGKDIDKQVGLCYICEIYAQGKGEGENKMAYTVIQILIVGCQSGGGFRGMF